MSQTLVEDVVEPDEAVKLAPSPSRWSRIRAAKQSRPPRQPRPPRRFRLPEPAVAAKLAPRDARWWTGAAVMAVSLMLLSFVLHATLISSLQQNMQQGILHDELRTALAKAETPIGQIGGDEKMVPAGTPIALIEIPALDLQQVVLEGTGGEVLQQGVGHRRDSVYPGQEGTAVLFGRQLAYGGPFEAINRLAPGDEIIVTTGQGENTFTVFGQRRSGDPEPEELRTGEGRLELASADGLPMFPTGVLYIDAALTSTTQQTPSRVMGLLALPESELVMGVDSGSWSMAFFVFVFFVAGAVGMWWAWTRWGRWQAWLIGVPVLIAFGAATSDFVMTGLPNLM